MPTTLMLKILAPIVLIAILFGYVGCQKKSYIAQGEHNTQVKWDASVKRGEKEVARLKAEAGKITTVTEVKYVDRVQTIKEKGDEIIKRVTVFVPNDSKCSIVDGGFRVFHDAAVENRIPDTAEIPNAAPTTLTEIASTIAGNYKNCTVAYETVKSWQTWATEQCKLNDKGCPNDGQ
jgi:hypothetical protein